MKKEVKINKMDNGYFVRVFDEDSDSRVPIKKLVAENMEKLIVLLKAIYEIK